MPLHRAALAMHPATAHEVFTASQRNRLATLVDIDTNDVVADWEQAADCEILITGWGAPRIDDKVLDRMPKLRTIIHSAGTVKTFMDTAVFSRGISVSSAAEANAIPVAEFTLAAVIFGAKRAVPMASWYRRQQQSRDVGGLPWIGARGIRVGVIGASRIGRRVLRLLRHLDVHPVLYDPYVSGRQAAELGAEKLELDELLATSDVVTVHAPDTPETHHLIDARRLALLADGSVLINTARGRLIEHEALIHELRRGRIDAILDVADPEPPASDSPLYTLPNVLMTPHIAGALGNEVHRLGESTVDEVARCCAGQPLRHEILASDWDQIA